MQNYIVFAVVALSIAFLAWRFMRRRGCGCGSGPACSGCSSRAGCPAARTQLPMKREEDKK